MATLIPDILPETIENNGERMFYAAASELPDEYTVLYSYKYQLPYDVRESIREADFVIVHLRISMKRESGRTADLDHLEGKLIELFGGQKPKQPAVINTLINKILAPSFETDRLMSVVS